MKNDKPKQVTAPANNDAQALIAKAIDNKVDVATMERLLEMRRQLKQEWAKEEFDKGMAAFQSKCPTIEKRKQAYNYKYAPLEIIVEQVKDLLSENGFSYTFDTEEADNAVVIICKVKHIAGHSETSKATIKKETTTKMNASQQSGAAMTYGKRYGFINAFGILTGDEDTDATGKSEGETRTVSNYTPSPKSPNGDTRYVDEDGVTHEPYSSKSAQTSKDIATLCDKCGAPAVDKKGLTKVGNKPYHGIFCSSKDKSHTKWINDRDEAQEQLQMGSAKSDNDYEADQLAEDADKALS